MALPLNPKLVEKETRFAVVMYGGISLAIYIHGAAQELYHMARATARMSDGSDDYLHPDKDLTGAEKIYRLLGKALKTKFVVDILSGTSAGGLNAVFLAKALARGKKMEFVKNFWVKEGDIAVLLNDAQSLKGLSGLALQTPSPALLNSQRFYYKLLEALMRYEEKDNEDSSEPYVAELDLNITATDIRGLSLPLFITNNNKIVEPRYKNVFQFYYRPETEHAGVRNDFTQECDPFLAFAARCTASIPPAFEAMQLKDIEPVLKTATFNKTYGHLTADAEAWRKFYKDYLNEGDDFAVRSFGDGGYLDNKPFSYATEALLRRRADLPVDRKLVYIEPSPVHAEDKPYPSEKPDMIENISAALSLPREETIREDLKTLRERNRIVGEINHILENVFSFQIVPPQTGEEAEHQWRHSLEWARKFPMEKEVQDWYRSGYYAYHQLRVERVMDNLARAFSRGLGWVEEGEQEARIRQALQTWLGELYGIAPEDGKYSQNDVLFRLDMSFRLRRFQFLQNLLNVFIRGLDAVAPEKKSYMESILRNAGLEAQAFTLDEMDAPLGRWLLVDLKKSVNNSHANARARAMEMRAWNLARLEKPSADLQEYARQLKALEKLMEEADGDGLRGVDLTQTLEKITLALGTHPFLSAEKSAGINREPSGYLYKAFKSLSDDALTLGIRFDRKDGLETLNYISDEAFADKLNAARKSYGWTDEAPDASAQSGRLRSFYHAAQKCLAYYHDNFDFYDMLTFPILYGTDAGESDIVEIIRISPEDGTRLVNEARSGRRKLAGTQLMNFGAFFKQEWRENDMLWGRLDTAEILITEMLRGADEEAVKTFEDSVIALYEKKTGDDPSARRAVVYDMMFTEILHEDLHVADRSFLYKLLNSNAEDMPASSPPAPPEDDEITLADAAMQLSRKMPGRIGKMFDPLTRLAKNIYRRDALQRIEEQVGKTLRAELGADPSPLRKQIMDALEAERRRLKRERKEVEETYKLEKNRRKDFERAESRGRKKLLGWLGRGSLRRDAGRIWAGLKKTNRLAFSRIVRAEDRERTLEYFRLGYETDPNFEPKPTIQAANRSILVLGDMLKGLSDKYPPGKKPAGFLLTAGRVLTAAVNFAIPKTLGELAFNTYWIWIAYIIAGVILWGAGAIGGASASKPEDALAVSEAVRRFAFQIFAVAAAFHTLVALINGWVSRKSARIWWIYGGEIGLGLSGLILGSDALTRLGFLLFGVTLTLHLPTRIFSISADNALGFIIKWAARGFIWLLKIAGLAFLAILFYSGMVNLGIFENAPLVDFFVGLLRGLISPAK